jgi:acetolactate synthase-1/2/3 large subunit
MTTVADAIAGVLRAEGVTHLPCYPRQLLIDACARVGIRPIVCRQERVGVGIADGISRSTNGRRIGVFAMQGGPGLENAFPGVAQVFSDNVPVLVFSGGPLGRSHTPPHFHALEHFRGVTKWAATLDDPARLEEIMRRAFLCLRSGKPGPVLIELPNDVIGAEAPVFEHRPMPRMRAAPDPVDVARIAKTLLAAARPVIHAGQGVLYAEATPELVALAELLEAPVLTTNTGKSAFPENHPLSIGASVISAPRMLYEEMGRADLVFAIGAGLLVNPWTPKIPAGKRIVQCTNAPEDIGREHPVEDAMVGDAKLALQALVEVVGAAIGPRGHRGRGTARTLSEAKAAWLAEWRDELESTEVPINQYRIVNELKRRLDPEKVVITHDAGTPREQLVPFWEATTPRGYLGWGKSTQLGHGLGLAIGAKLAHPDRICINLMGDASIGMVGMDLETAVRHRIGTLTIVFNNGVMAGERMGMKDAVERYDAADLGGNYRDVARGLGVWAERVERPEGFGGVLDAALEATHGGRPALIECMAKLNDRFSRYPTR